jgi:hypothetical protein
MCPCLEVGDESLIFPFPLAHSEPPNSPRRCRVTESFRRPQVAPKGDVHADTQCPIGIFVSSRVILRIGSLTQKHATSSFERLTMACVDDRSAYNGVSKGVASGW